MFKYAIVRKPAENFADGLTSVDLGVPDFSTTLAQHSAYCQTLVRCGLALTELPPDPNHPDSTFVEDTAILTERCAILTRPGAPSRQGEVSAIRPAVEHFYENVFTLEPPGTLDGGDICDAEGQFFIGISDRTNEAGAKQLAVILQREGYSCSFVDVRRVPGILHLKSGIAYLGDNHLLLIDALLDHPDFTKYNRIRVPKEETYAANCVRINDFVLIPAGFPQVYKAVEKLGLMPIPQEMSEFAKMDGGLSCLSLRFNGTINPVWTP